MHRRLALLAATLACIAPAVLRRASAGPEPPRACEPEGRGVPPLHWIGCSADAGPRRALTGRERLLVGLAVDVNAAQPDDLADVPGLSQRLAAEIVADRGRGGPFPSVDALIRVRGIGPVRLARARAALTAGADPVQRAAELR